MMRLYSYFRSSSAYRVRIAMNLKNLEYEIAPIHLLNEEQLTPEHRELNPYGQVPCLEVEGTVINQSVAICMYLDSIQDDPMLFPTDPVELAKVMEICELINSGIQPLQNLRVLKFLKKEFSADDAKKLFWATHWNTIGLQAVEKILEQTRGFYAFGDTVTAADCFIQPQIYSARRFHVDIESMPNLKALEEQYAEMDAFVQAHPDNQPDAPK